MPHGGFEAISLQLSITVSKPSGLRLTRKLVDEAVRRWADSDDGEAPDGFDIRIVDWNHPGRTEPPHKAASFSQDELRERFRGLLQRGTFNVRVRYRRSL